ncbi:unnamed protein product [Lathyrus oleraceus]|uniref:Replication protein A 70 kDa DNA-binding subunit B/D first OB fold domain-containing protein n=1 Tax=Pisum sativum TaxID=3888 RepID=A0A9D4X898_PEA|nr:hypothetical protein KIW84_040278 [Pisum sativum]
MARQIEKICDLNDIKEPWKVAVRVDHKWLVLSNNKEHFEMIFIDKDRANIHVVVPATYMATFKDKLIVDHTYIVSNFNVQENDLVFKPSSHKYMVKFTRGTYVNDVNKHVIPPKTLNFNSFADIMTDRLQKDVLIGMVDSIGFTQAQSGGKKQQVNFITRDHNNNIINYILWEAYASQFIK